MSNNAAAAEPPQVEHPIQGRYIRLESLRESHSQDLWRNLGFDDGHDPLKWLPWARPKDADELWRGFEGFRQSRGMVIYAIVGDPDHVNPPSSSMFKDQPARQEALGTIGFLDINLQHRTIESGGVIFGTALKRSAAATEAHYLLLRTACEPGDSPPYRRIAWKNNALNTASRRAAERVGYKYEGTWRNHWLIDGKSRDSDWLSIIDEEWPTVKQALEAWLDDNNFANGKQLRSLEDIRHGAEKSD
jgi:RimJ/RimL family protein N-acetyltransferase